MFSSYATNSQISHINRVAHDRFITSYSGGALLHIHFSTFVFERALPDREDRSKMAAAVKCYVETC